jgi:hypothetical protein
MEMIGVLPDGIGYGNVSARIAGTNRFVVTGSGTGLKFPIAPEHFLRSPFRSTRQEPRRLAADRFPPRRIHEPTARSTPRGPTRTP